MNYRCWENDSGGWENNRSEIAAQLLTLYHGKCL